MYDQNVHHDSYSKFYDTYDSYDNYYDFCHLLTQCLPCFEGELHHHLDCGACPQITHIVHSVDNLVYQVSLRRLKKDFCMYCMYFLFLESRITKLPGS